MTALVVGFYAGPGAGKSTMAAHVFALLKWAGIRAELVTEFAKEVYWEQRPIPDPFYVIAKQYHRLVRVVPHVDVVVTDAPLLLGLAYTRHRELQRVITDYATRFHMFHIFLHRRKPYDPVGRYQAEPEAVALDRTVENMLEDLHLTYASYPARPWAANDIYEAIVRRLRHDQHASQDTVRHAARLEPHP
jgi:hypothetical protein